MYRLFKIVLLLIISFGLKAQTQHPNYLPNPNAPAGYIRQGYVAVEKGLIFKERDTFCAKYPTLIKHLNQTFYYTNGGCTAWYPLVTNNNYSVINIINNNLVSVCSYGTNLCDTFITTVAAQLVTITSDTTILVCDTSGNCETFTVSHPVIPSNFWSLRGNAIAGDSNVLGSTTNKALQIITANTLRYKIDSLGNHSFRTNGSTNTFAFETATGYPTFRISPNTVPYTDFIMTGNRGLNHPNWRLRFKIGYDNGIYSGVYTSDMFFGYENLGGATVNNYMNLKTSGNLIIGNTVATDYTRSLILMNSQNKGFTKPRMTTVERDKMTGFFAPSIAPTTRGSGYVTPPVITFSGGGAGAVQATATAILSGDSISSIAILTPGAYSSLPTINIDNTGTGGSGLTVTLATPAHWIPVLEGTEIYNLTTQKTNYWDGVQWVEAGAGGGNTDSLFAVQDNSAAQERAFDFNGHSFRLQNVPERTALDSSSKIMLLQTDSVQKISASYFAPNIHPNACLTGCTVTPSDTAINSYTYVIAASTGYINNIFFSTPQTTVTLDPSDATNDRIDFFVVQTSNTSTDITGTAANPALDPDYDASTQLVIGRATVGAGTIAPTITTKVVYKENAGTPTEYTTAASHVSINPNSTNNPWAGSKDVEFTAVTNGRNITYTWSTTIDFSDVNDLIFRIRSKANWQTRKLVFQWLNGVTPVGVAIPFGEASYGYVSTNTSDYQLMDIPLSDFGNITGATKLRMQVSAPSGSIGAYIDNVLLISESIVVAPSGIVAVNGISPISVSTVNNVATVSSTMNNIGSGHRILAGNKASVKTLFGSNTVTIDSSSNTNALTIKADTSTLATQYDLTLINSSVNNAGAGYRLVTTNGTQIKTVDRDLTLTIDSLTANKLTWKVDTSQIATQYDLTQIGGGSGLNIYNSDSTLSSNRTVHAAGRDFVMDSIGNLGLYSGDIGFTGAATSIEQTPLYSSLYAQTNSNEVSRINASGSTNQNILSSSNLSATTLGQITTSTDSIELFVRGAAKSSLITQYVDYTKFDNSGTVAKIYVPKSIDLDVPSPTRIAVWDADTLKSAAYPSLGGGGTVTDVTASAPIIITGTSTITPNVTADTSAGNTHLATQAYVLNHQGGGTSMVKETHTTGATITLGNTTTWLVVNPGSLLAALTVTMPATPTDGQTIDISFGGTITASGSAVVTAFVVAANAGQGLIGTGTYGVVETDDHIVYRFNSTNSKWYRN